MRKHRLMSAAASASGLLSGVQSVSADTVTATAFVGGTAHQVQAIWTVQGYGASEHCS